MGNFIGQMAEQMANQATGGILGMFLGGINDSRQIRQQQALQNMQISGQKQMIDYGMMKQLEMWKNTSYGAQVEQMKKAGINPALLYGMSGGGGQSTGNPSGNVQGANAPQGGREIQDIMGMGLMQAQKANIEADTRLKEVDANKREGVDTQKVTTEIAAIAQGINNSKAQEGLMKVDTMLKELDLKVMGATTEERTDEIIWRSLRALEELDQVARQSFIQKATMNAIIDTAITEAAGALLKNELTATQTQATQKGIQVNDAQINKWAKEIVQIQQGLDRQENELKLKAWEAEIKANFPGISQSIGKIITGALEELRDKLPGKKSPGYQSPIQK